MSTEAERDELAESTSRVTKVREALEDHLKELVDAVHSLKTDVDTAAGTSPAAENVKRDLECKAARQRNLANRRTGRRVRFCSILLVWLVACLVLGAAMGKDPEWDKPLLVELKDQLAFLAFAVALASYLASVIRESVKSLHAMDESCRKEDRRDAISLVITGEQAIVLLGIMTVIRIACAPLGANVPVLSKFPLGYTDHALAIYLGVVIAYLAWLHFMQWRMLKNREVI